MAIDLLRLCPDQDSNLDLRLRRPVLCPLSYQDVPGVSFPGFALPRDTAPEGASPDGRGLLGRCPFVHRVAGPARRPIVEAYRRLATSWSPEGSNLVPPGLQPGALPDELKDQSGERGLTVGHRFTEAGVTTALSSAVDV